MDSPGNAVVLGNSEKSQMSPSSSTFRVQRIPDTPPACLEQDLNLTLTSDSQQSNPLSSAAIWTDGRRGAGETLAHTGMEGIYGSFF